MSQAMPSKKPLISVLIPVYNVEKYLRQCLDSVISQTLKDIEIICVNDGSTDSSLQILQEYAKKDKRITVIDQQNQGTLLARKNAVAESSGKYICFIDSDDWLAGDDSLLTMYESIERESVDMLQFPVAFSSKDKLELRHFQRRFSYNPTSLEGASSIIKHWYDNSFWFMCVKIYRAEVVRRAFEVIESHNSVMWEDVYATFIISYFSKSFKSIAGDSLLVYRLGSGISTRAELSLNDFVKYFNAFGLLDILECFLKKRKQYDQYREILDGLYNRFSENAFKSLFKVKTRDLRNAFDKLLEYCDVSQFLKRFSEKKYFRYGILSKVTFGDMRRRYARKKRELRVIIFLNRYLKSKESI